MSSALGKAIGRIRPLRRLVGTQDNLGRKRAPVIGAAFLDWLDRHPGRPFFAFLNYYDAHRPYLPPEPFASRFRTPGVPLHARVLKENGGDPDPPAERIQGAIDAYDGSIAWLDAELARLFDSLAARGMLQNTIVILTADHGEEFLEHGMWDHGNSLYLPSVHVPLVVSWPGRVAAGSVVRDPVSIRDVPATVVSLTRGTAAPFPGASLLRLMTPGEGDTAFSDVRRVVRQPEWYPASAGDLTSVVAGQWHFIRNLGTGREELYDLSRDPMEKSDLAAQMEFRGVLSQMRAATVPFAH
jgi:arylsulfatase A-like enzyme